MPHPRSDDHPRSSRVMQVLRNTRAVAVAQAGLGRARLWRGSHCSPGFPDPTASCPRHSARQTKPPQVLARASLPRTGAPGGHQEPGGSVGMEREQKLFFLEQRGVSPLGSSCPEGKVGGWHVNDFERFVAIYFLFC